MKKNTKQNQKPEEKSAVQYKRMFMFALYGVGLLIVFFLLFYAYILYTAASKRLIYMTKLNDVIAQISQVVDNVRQAHILYNEGFDIPAHELNKKDFIPKVLIEHNHLRNIYGGEILIGSSEPISNKMQTKTSPTFKLSFQGLSKEACIDLAQMNWGDRNKGLLAVAIGSVNKKGEDAAFHDVDAPRQSSEIREYMGEDGRVHRTMEYLPEKRNLVKPGDPYMSPPFRRSDAELGCDCSMSNTCSLALRYTVFKVD